ncbi:hypothetical protein [Nocardia sp. A7]|uniref:hypothetical protein n=1 Tax=Nocardia sp. A7 TaxID=2789274 RepID=UPI003978D808
MLYDKGALQTLSDELAAHRTALLTESGNLQGAAKRLSVAWEGNEGFASFANVKAKWDMEFGSDVGADPESTIGTMDALSKAVQQALINAFQADGKVSAGFGG